MQSTQPVLEVRNLSRTFARSSIHAVDNVDLDVQAGEIVSILGPSGCGKTTMMRMIAGLDTPTSGEIRILGRNVVGKPPYKRNVGLVFQSLAIFPHMSVQQNVAFGLRMQGLPADVIRAKVEAALELVQLPVGIFAARRPGQLSGGQLQRVALARTLVTEPALVLFDEPMAALDRRLRDYMAVELRSIQKTLGIAAIYVTHDQETASAMSDRVVILNAGKVLQVGSPAAIYDMPDSRFVAEFLGDANVLRVERVDDASGVPVAHTEGGGILKYSAAQRPVVAGMLAIFRPEQTLVHAADPGGAALRGSLASTQFRSGLFRWQIALDDGGSVIGQSTENRLRHCAVGDPVWASIDADKVRFVRQ